MASLLFYPDFMMIPRRFHFADSKLTLTRAIAAGAHQKNLRITRIWK